MAALEPVVDGAAEAAVEAAEPAPAVMPAEAAQADQTAALLQLSAQVDSWLKRMCAVSWN